MVYGLYAMEYVLTFMYSRFTQHLYSQMLHDDAVVVEVAYGEEVFYGDAEVVEADDGSACEEAEASSLVVVAEAHGPQRLRYYSSHQAPQSWKPHQLVPLPYERW